VAIITVLKDQEALAAAAAERVTSLIEASIAVRHAARVCLSGGRTPRRLYELLADSSRPWRGRIDWTRVHVCWSDERQVPPDHPESNFGMAHRALLAHVPLPAAQVHRMRGELPDAADAAREYEIELSAASLNGPPLCDVLLLGLGEDGHIASIFPGSLLLGDAPEPANAGPHVRMGVGAGGSRLGGSRVAAVWVEHLHTWRITLTPSALLAARAIVVLVSGTSKAAALSAALDGPEDVKRWPAQLLRAAGDRVEWLIDSAAARWPAAPLS
jgi:6-phosphogluconolactonase